MNQTNVIPTEGRFVAIWVFDNKLKSSTYKAKAGKYWLYSDCDLDFIPLGNAPILGKTAIYFTKE